MHDSNLLNLLKTFSREEFREFGLLTESPFFNREKVLIKLYGILKNYYPDFESKELDKKTVYHKLFDGKIYYDALMRNTISDFLKLTEEYLKILQLRKDPFYSQYLLLKELTNRKQQKLFKMNFKKGESILNRSDIRDEIYYQNKFLLEDESRRNIVVNSSKVIYKEDNLNEQAYSLHVHYMVENIKLYAIMLNQKKFTYDHKFDFTIFETLRKYLEENFHTYEKIPYITIFYYCVMLYKTDEKKYFDRLRVEMKKHYKKLTPTDQKNMYMVLTNHSNMQIKKGNFEFYDELFEINKDLLKTKAYFEGNDFMPHYIYNVIALNAIALNKLDWAEKFINRYRKLIHSDFRESAYNYCMSNLLIEKGNYNEALERLSKVTPYDSSSKLFINSTLLKIYFCKNESEAFFSLVDSFRHLLKRNKDIKQEDRIYYNNFITKLKKIYSLKMKPISDKADLLLQLKEIENSNYIILKKWLLDQTEKLIKN